jgi:hypothetical protein
MITVELTSVSGTVKEMPFENKDRVLEFIERYADALPLGSAVNINAPLIGIHSGWIQGRKSV